MENALGLAVISKDCAAAPQTLGSCPEALAAAALLWESAGTATPGIPGLASVQCWGSGDDQTVCLSWLGRLSN